MEPFPIQTGHSETTLPFPVGDTVGSYALPDKSVDVPALIDRVGALFSFPEREREGERGRKREREREREREEERKRP